MTVETTTTFDVATFKRAYEEWDIDALLALYADDVELIQVDRDHPPSSPRTRHGSDVLRGMLEHCAGAGVVATVENTIADAHRAAATITCEFPGGRRVLANAILELEDGRIVRELDVLSGDRRERERDEAKCHRHCLRGGRPRRTVGYRLGEPGGGARAASGSSRALRRRSSRLAPSATRSPASREACRGSARRSSARSPRSMAAIAPRRATVETRNQASRGEVMPKASKESASEHETVEGYEGHFEHFDGGWTVGFEAYSQDADLAPFFKGLPNDECQCEHMGYVIRGKVGFRSGGNEELFEAGDAYYVGPGHTPILYAGTEVVEFSPTKELGETMEVVTKNMEQMEASA